MKSTSQILAFMFCLSSICAHAAPSDTDRYVALLADLLERKSIGDDELVQLIEHAEQGKVINPISQDRADVSICDFIDHETAQKWVDEGALDAEQIAKWAEENLVEQESLRKKRKQTQEDTKKVWEELPPELLSAGHLHTYATTKDGTLKCWGGFEPFVCVVPSDLGQVQSVSEGTENHACALKRDGTVRCWGRFAADFFNVTSLFGVVQSMSVGEKHICVVKDGKLHCHGGNGKLCGVPADLGVVKSVSAGGWCLTCAVKADGKLLCWQNQNSPTKGLDPPSDLGIVQSVSAGHFYVCAVKADGTVKCWGRNDDGQCNVPDDLGQVRSVAADFDHTCAVKIDGQLQCWGENTAGQTDVPEDLGIVDSVSVGARHTCARKPDGSVRCWGRNQYGQCDVPLSLLYPNSWLSYFFAIYSSLRA